MKKSIFIGLALFQFIALSISANVAKGLPIKTIPKPIYGFEGWNRKQAITIQSSQVVGSNDLTDFPVFTTRENLDTGIVERCIFSPREILLAVNMEEIPIVSSLASDDDGNVVANAHDNDLGTRWSSAGYGQWAQFDLGSLKNFNEIQIAFYAGTLRTCTFDILVSNDGITWTTVESNLVSSGTTSDLESFSIPSQNSRYVRYLGYGNSNSNWNSILEFKIFNNTSNSGGSGSIWNESTGVASYSGGVAIGTASVPTGYKLAVEGKIRAREVRVDQDTWPDYVFTKGYRLPTLEEIQKHIEEKGHLPNIPSAKEVEANGVELGEMNRLLLEKVEELTLHVIKLKKEIEILKAKNQ
jgi:hypothetical protein